METCPAVPPGAGFVSAITGYVDCQAQVLGSGAWQALAAPGSTLSVTLTGFLTIFIALIGYNLLLGTSLTVRDGTLAFVKIGAVFALATSWPAYRTLVYDLVIDGPAQLVSEIGPQAGVVGSDGTLLTRLDLADHSMAQLAILGPGNAPPPQISEVPPPPFGGFDSFALGGSRILFLLTAISGMTLVRIVTGLMLGLGPFFIAFLMFDSTRSLFEGWVRVLAGSALAAFGVSVALGLQLALLEPWLSAALARRMAGEAMPTLPTELFVISCLFTILVITALMACARVTRGFRLAPVFRMIPIMADRQPMNPVARVGRGAARASQAEPERTRAVAVATMLASTSRREFGELAFSSAATAPPNRTPEFRSTNTQPTSRTPPLGQSFRRRPGSRASAVAARRDSGE